MVPLFAAAMAGDVSPSRVAVLDVEIDEDPGANAQEAVEAAVVRALEQAGHAPVTAGQACAEPSCMRAVAERLDASHVVRVGMNVAGTDYTFALELVEAKSGQVVGRIEGACEICTYHEAAEAVYERARVLELPSEDAPARVPIVVTSTPPGATVHVDGLAAGTTPFRGELEPGDHEIEVAKRGYESIRQRISGDGEPAQLQFDLLRTRYRPGPAGYAGWAVAVTGLATLVGGVALIAINDRQVESNCSGEQVDAAGNCEYRYDTLAGGVTMTVLGAMGVGGGAGLVLWDHKRKSSKVTASVGFGGVGLQGRF